ncbi:MAG: hypothetical protein FJ267_00725, partial [Planctomycetes bacterium]|nr:hypothetical protein [Planctomycetota bacterium]
MQAIVVTFDQFATSAMGCYGNEWVETPNFDRLAAEGIVFDQHFAEHIGDSTGMGFGTGRLPWDGSSRPYELKSGWSHVVGQHGIEIELVREFDVLPWSMTLARTANTLLATCQPTEAGGHPVDLSNKSLGIDESTDELPDTIPFAQLVQSAKERLKV